MPINSMHAFLQIDTIKGESLDADHKGQIEILDFDFETKQPRSPTASSIGGQTAARVEMSAISILKKIDLASTALFQACAGGVTVPKAQMKFYRADKNGNPVNYFTIELINVLVHRLTSRVGDDGMIQETLELSFGAIKQTYTQQKPEGGQGGKSVAQWSLTNNKAQFSA